MKHTRHDPWDSNPGPIKRPHYIIPMDTNLISMPLSPICLVPKPVIMMIAADLWDEDGKCHFGAFRLTCKHIAGCLPGALAALMPDIPVTTRKTYDLIPAYNGALKDHPSFSMMLPFIIGTLKKRTTMIHLNKTSTMEIMMLQPYLVYIGTCRCPIAMQTLYRVLGQEFLTTDWGFAMKWHYIGHDFLRIKEDAPEQDGIPPTTGIREPMSAIALCMRARSFDILELVQQTNPCHVLDPGCYAREDGGINHCEINLENEWFRENLFHFFTLASLYDFAEAIAWFWEVADMDHWADDWYVSICAFLMKLPSTVIVRQVTELMRQREPFQWINIPANDQFFELVQCNFAADDNLALILTVVQRIEAED